MEETPKPPENEPIDGPSTGAEPPAETRPPWAGTTELPPGARDQPPLTADVSVAPLNSGSLLAPGDPVKYMSQNGKITGVHDGGTYDVQIVDETGEPKKAGSGQPLWYERVPASEIERR
jgi:hypothetical protein